MTKEEENAIEALDIPLKELQFFDVHDPFNDHQLEGYISRRGDHRYGALYITKIDGKPCPQRILATPKFPYPFDKNGMFRFPKNTKEVLAYEKLDGTNIFAYKYRIWGGDICVTYKTRLLPVVGESRFGPFLTYWREILEKYPTIPDVVRRYPGYGLSFELVGARNKHLIIYDFPLDTRLLFGVRLDGTLEPPTKVGHLPCLPPHCTIAHTLKGLENVYKAMQDELEAGLTTDDVLGGYRGAEGRVWYMSAQDQWYTFKCKPSTIEAIHWAAGGLGASVIKATAYNVLENHPYCTPELIKELLLEEFNETEIDISWTLIMRVSAQINRELETRNRVFDLYKQTGLDFAVDPPAVMRSLSSHIPKSQMRYAYSLLAGTRR
jgi:hypothetical protein